MISIVCPVFNTSTWLPGCIDSVLAQDYGNYELLLVDDGSTDGSCEICESYAAKDARIRVFRQEHGGVSAARNMGLEQMKGEWVCFLDSDDEWMSGGLQTLAEGVSEGVDLVMMGYESLDEKGNLVYSVSERTCMTLSSQKGLMQLFKPTHYRYLGYVWSKLFRSSVIRKEGCRFAEDLHYCEDRLFTVQFVCASKRPVYYSTTPVYYYRLHPDSAMASLGRSFNPDFLSDLDGTIRIREWVRSSFPGEKALCKVADRNVYGSYRYLSQRIRTFGYREDGLQGRLRAKAMDSIGKGTYAAFALRRVLGGIWTSCCR